MTDNLERLHRALVDAMRRTRGDDFETPITVSQIYQELVPYRVARSAIGFEMNADYEFALLRLLAGDRDLARLDPPEVRALLRKEMDSPNPNVSLFRAYANCDVWISPPQDWVSEMFAEEPAAQPPAAEDEWELIFEPEVENEPTSELTGAPAPEPAAPPTPAQPRPRFVPEIVDEPAATPAAPPAAAPAASARPHQCAFCGGNLPDSRLVNFCPHCGNDLTQQPCSNCGEILEANWRFCVNCGTPAATYDTQAN